MHVFSFQHPFNVLLPIPNFAGNFTIYSSPASSIAALLSVLSLATGTLFAGPLTVTNPGFEVDGDVAGPAAITGWSAAAVTYGVNAATATEAVRSARLNNPGTLSQLTSETITTGYTYQLSADVGQLAAFSGGKAKLELYGSTSGTIWQSLEISPPSGGWLNDQFVRFDATAVQAGQTLGIRLLSTGGTELRFDNIRLKRTLDSDYDGLEDADETIAGSNPNSRDSDGDGAWDGAEVIAGFSPTNANSRPLRIMCMGDSITVGYTDNPNYNEPFEYGYRSGLYTRLNNAGYKFSYVGYSNQPWFGPPHYFVPPPAGPSRDGDPTKGDTVFPKIDLPALGQNGHHGYGGNGINAMSAGWVTSDKPDVILLMIGINDIKKAGDNPSAALASKVDEILAAKSPNAHLIVAQITPYSGFWQEVLNYNTYIRDTLVPTKAAQGHKISTVDLYSLFLSDPNNYGSSIKAGMHSTANHPNNIAYEQMAEAWFHGIESLSLNGADILPPTIVSLSPMDGATNVPTGGNLVIVFNEDVQKGSGGNIVLRKSSDNSIVETIPIISAQATLSGRNLTIDPTGTLDSGTAYHVLIDAGVILDDTTPAPNAFAGIADSTRWNFTTTVPDTFPPTVSVFSPADNSSGVSLIADLVVTFNENIQKGTGVIELRKTSDNTLVESFPVSSAAVSISGVNVSIDRTVSLEANTGYHIVIPGTAFKDLFDLPYAGTLGATTWNFTTGTFSVGPVAITNPSFENGLGGTGVGDVALGWTWPGSTTWGHAVGNNAGTIPSGNGSKCYVIQGNANAANNWELYQITGEVMQAGKTYTLEVDLFSIGGWASTTEGKIQLIARDGAGAINLLAETAGSFGFTAINQWAPNQRVEYIATAAQAGKSLGIGLVTSASTGNLAFDNVRITASSAAGPDTTPPNLNSKLPEDNATGVAINTNLTATFDENIQLGSGTITLDNLSGGDDVVIDVASHAGQLSVAGALLTINPSSDLANNSSYAILFAPGSVRDTAAVPNAFAGISDTSAWNFNTAAVDNTAPATSLLNPLDNANNVAVNENLVITLNESVQKGAGNIVITQTGGSVFETIPVTDARVSVIGAIVTINPNGAFANNTAYHIEIASGAIEDLAGNDFPGISGTTAWNFTTVAGSVVSTRTIVYGFDTNTAAMNGSNTGQTALSAATSNDFGSGILASDWTAVSPTGGIAVSGGQMRALKKVDTDTHTFTVTIPSGVTVDFTNLSFNFGRVNTDPSEPVWTVSSNLGGGTFTPTGITGSGTNTQSFSSSLGGNFSGVTNTSITFTLTDAAGGNQNSTSHYTWIDNVTLTGSLNSGGPAPLDNFLISAISSPQTVGTPITGITLTARDASNATVTGFTGTVNFSGTGGFTGTSGTFTAGVLTGVSVTPTNAGSGLTLIVTDGVSGKTGSATITTIQTQYQGWAGGALFDADANNDGVKNGLAFLLGASSPTGAVTLPTVSHSAGNLIMNFNMLNAASRGSASIKVQQSSDLGISDAWVDSATVPNVAGISSPVNGVSFNVTLGSPSNGVVATVAASEALPGTKLFARLKAEQ